MAVKVLDRAGRELKRGSRVERCLGGVKGRIGGTVVKPDASAAVWVRWDGYADLKRYETERPRLLSRTRRCPDLELIDPPST